MTFKQILEMLRDDNGYIFTHPNLKGQFCKAAYPLREDELVRDGAASAITYWENGIKASPTFLLSDFDDNTWTCSKINYLD